MNKKRVLVVDDEPFARSGVCAELLKVDDFDIKECGNVEDALELLRKHTDFSLVLVDLRLPETRQAEAEHQVSPGAGAALLRRISNDFPFASRNLVLYTTKGAIPDVGDMQHVLRAGASALAAFSGVSKEKVFNDLKAIVNGEWIVHAPFKNTGIVAIDPENECPFDQVEYYCIRLIAENRGKKGAAEKWNEERSQEIPLTEHIIDDLLEDIYARMAEEYDDFYELGRDAKQRRLSKWYHDDAVPRYGRAVPVDYVSKNKRTKSRLSTENKARSNQQ
ncbi:MAG: hypothetical protein DPW21_00755 [Anaerolineae bacterium]|nr:response regulator [Chloroflexi bacterium CFX2]MCQ3945210.1 hypothetical protein [Anaerolineae bacterium]MCZ7547552.1 response regulator [Anaerolineales bacterium]GER79105.1 hypothetical protein DIM_11860 [Candidatus Denitrolinea symbiosum]HPO85052.1 response regulator [Candidatus Hydrogenedentota bacterium]